MPKDLAQLRKDWEDAGRSKDYRYSIFSAKDFSEPTFDLSGTISRDILLNILKDWKVDLPNKTIVDYGCGAGRVTKYISQVAKWVVGIDISTEMINRFTERLGDIQNVDLYVGSGESLRPLLDGSVDIIYSLWVFQHIPNDIVYKIVKDCHRVLRKGGLLIFQMAIDKEHRAGIYAPLPACSLEHWTEKEVMDMYHSVGFTTYGKYNFRENYYYVFQK